MDWSWRKYSVVLGIVGIIILMPFLLVSTAMMDVYQERIDAEPETEFNRWLQLNSAWVCAKTWRHELAAHRYRRFTELYPKDPEYRYALLNFASSLEDAGKISDAYSIYVRFMAEFPDGEDHSTATAGMIRLRYQRPPADREQE